MSLGRARNVQAGALEPTYQKFGQITWRIAMAKKSATALLLVTLLAAGCGGNDNPMEPSGPTTETFSNAAAITVPGGAPAATSGTASPYPATINVTGVSGNISDLNVRLSAITHTFPDDIDVLLVGPQGQAVVLMSDTGGSVDLAGVTLTFDQSTGTSLPDATVIATGTYLPTNIGDGDPFDAPAPAGPYNQTLEVFNGTNPNGTWRLFVDDDAGSDIGVIGAGWSLEITN
jgi:subtilisin-like proprotein convertase family protein